jgi:flagellar basal-body rod protein FlgB
MFNSMFSSPSLKSLEQTVSFTERRHAILASNVANMDTPGYQQRDLSLNTFQDNLRDAIQAERQSQEMSPGLRLGMFGAVEQPSQPSIEEAKNIAMENVRDSMKQIVYHDGSDDNLEMHVTQISKNQSMHTMAVAMMKSHYRQLQMAISGSVNA